MVQNHEELDETEIARKKQTVIDQHGPWGCNIRLGGNTYTQEPHSVGVVNERVQRIVQIVADNAGKPLERLRILDLAAFEGAFAIEFARHGADVVMVEARDPHIAKARFVKEVLGLENLEVIQDDVRNITVDRLGSFDVVLCLGILYHLDAKDLIPFLSAIEGLTNHLAVLETQMSLRARDQLKGPKASYWGRYFGENVEQLGAAIDSPKALWLTKSSLMNLLNVKGQPQDIVSAPESVIAKVEKARWLEGMKPMNEPRQRVVTLVQERVARVFGKSIYDKLWGRTRT